jgi:hypothetical protein
LFHRAVDSDFVERFVPVRAEKCPTGRSPVAEGGQHLWDRLRFSRRHARVWSGHDEVKPHAFQNLIPDG